MHEYIQIFLFCLLVLALDLEQMPGNMTTEFLEHIYNRRSLF